MALVSVKNHYHGSLNPMPSTGKAVTLEEVLQSRHVVGPLTVHMCSPLGDGAAAALIVSDEFARRKGLKGPRVNAVGAHLGRGDDHSMAPSIRRAATQAYEDGGDRSRGHLTWLRYTMPLLLRNYYLPRICGFVAPGDGPKNC